MIKIYKFYLIFLLSLGSSYAQFTPVPSPGASTNQTIGVTFLNVEYSRPGVKGREIFGGLVPFNKVWRTGANAATIFETSTDILVNGKLLRAGVYSLLSIPGETEWTIIFNKNLEVTEQTYYSIEDELRVTAIPELNEFTETFTFDFSDIKDNVGKLNLKWAKTKISLKIEVDNLSTIKQAIEVRSLETAGAFLQSAEYLLNNNLDLNLAEQYIDMSIMLAPSFRNHWIKGRLLFLRNEKQEALNQFKIAQELGANDPVYELFKETIETEIQNLSN